ncbi:peptide chain release factor N(5)-glutamine methyltransferase [Parerythrobacter aestuarii]|uniref:peptide chain release factor N(5)-glutamine methyltransferase n=1 Tax=Parerythrobacter aestuarii TaxID=3020909 RepID=UPI0024DE43D0|nr:peptide chain release factor N(5)-glutamine methyltransferase [Parerythrobacter aestuarii]
MTTVADALRTAAERLSATSDTARLDAELLMAHALGVTRSELLLRHQRDSAPAAFDDLVTRRLRHEPIAYLTGEQEFFGRIFDVEPGILIPRADSETVVAAALEACPAPQRVLDCGTGSGALLLTILAECPGACGIGIDASPTAVEVAGENAIALDIEGDWAFHLRDWNKAGWAGGLGSFDLVIANPPYVETGAELAPSVRDHEPPEALFSGPEGLDDYRALIPQLADLLTPEGIIVLEIGYRQADSVAAMAAENGYESTLRHDLAGRPRALILRKGLGKGRITG